MLPMLNAPSGMRRRSIVVGVLRAIGGSVVVNPVGELLLLPILLDLFCGLPDAAFVLLQPIRQNLVLPSHVVKVGSDGIDCGVRAST